MKKRNIFLSSLALSLSTLPLLIPSSNSKQSPVEIPHTPSSNTIYFPSPLQRQRIPVNTRYQESPLAIAQEKTRDTPKIEDNSDHFLNLYNSVFDQEGIEEYLDNFLEISRGLSQASQRTIRTSNSRTQVFSGIQKNTVFPNQSSVKCSKPDYFDGKKYIFEAFPGPRFKDPRKDILLNKYRIEIDLGRDGNIEKAIASAYGEIGDSSGGLLEGVPLYHSFEMDFGSKANLKLNPFGIKTLYPMYGRKGTFFSELCEKNFFPYHFDPKKTKNKLEHLISLMD